MWPAPNFLLSEKHVQMQLILGVFDDVLPLLFGQDDRDLHTSDFDKDGQSQDPL